MSTFMNSIVKGALSACLILDPRKSYVAPGFRRLWLGRTISLLGQYTFRISLILFILERSNGASALSNIVAILLIPTIMSYLLGGILGDWTRSRKNVMIYLDIARFLAMAAGAFAAYISDEVWPVIALAFAASVAGGLFEPIGFGFMGQLVPKNKLLSANSAISIGRQIAIIGGPILGALVVDHSGPQFAFLFNSLTFAASAVALWAIPFAGSSDEARISGGKAGRSLIEEMFAGLRYILSVRWLWITLATAAVANAMFTGGLDVSVPLILAGDKSTGSLLGTFYTLQGLGALIGAAILSRMNIRGVATPLFIMLMMMSLSLALVGALGDSLFTPFLAMAYGVGMHWFNSLYPALVQSQVPTKLLSRVSSFEFLAFDGLMPLGVLLIGRSSVHFGVSQTLIVAGLAVAFAVFLASLSPSVRALQIENINGDKPVAS